MSPGALLNKPAHPFIPTEEEDQAAEAAAALNDFLRRCNVEDPIIGLTAHDNTRLALPSKALHLLVDVLAHIAIGNSSAVNSLSIDVGTQQAAEILNVRHDYVLELLQKKVIPSCTLGDKRRIPLTELLAYRCREKKKQDAALQALIDETESLGLDYWG